MATSPLDVPAHLRQAGWKVKIYQNERLEDPHVTILCKTEKWRWNLRDRSFLEESHSWNHIPHELRLLIEAGYESLVNEWNRLHPDNRV